MKTDYPDAAYLCNLAKRCGDVILSNFNPGMKKEWKSDNTPLTVTDTNINTFVCTTISRDYPHIRIVGEEESHDVENAEYTAICDPVDGTIPFSHGLPISTFCIVILKGHTPLVGVIYDPFMKRMWHATRNKGSFLGTKRSKVSRHALLEKSMLYAVILNSRNPSFYDTTLLGQRLAEEYAIIIDAAAIAYFGGLVATGEFDATIHSGTKAWETAAMQIIVEEAGGKATDIYGNDLCYGHQGEMQGHIISNGKIHDALVKIIEECPPRH